SCEVCHNTGIRPVLDLGRHPMCDDLVPINDPRVCEEYPIEILLCEECLTAHQRFQIPKRQLFAPTYHYRSRHTADVLNGMEELATVCEATLGPLRGKSVLEIGCNDGSLLSQFQRKGALTFGVEPTAAAEDAAKRGHRIWNDFFSEQMAKAFAEKFGQMEIITFTNVFAHIEDLPDVIRGLKILSGPQTCVVIENHYLGSILDKKQFDTFYHEHPRTYSYRSFTYIAESLGMQIVRVEFPKRYGGNIRIFLAKPNRMLLHDRDRADIESKERSFIAGFARLPRSIDLWRSRKREELDREVARNGKLAAKAFPGRAAILLKLLQVNESQISDVYEK